MYCSLNTWLPLVIVMVEPVLRDVGVPLMTPVLRLHDNPVGRFCAVTELGTAASGEIVQGRPLKHTLTEAG